LAERNGRRWRQATAVFFDTTEFLGVYFIRLTDRAGNVTVFNSDGVVIDLGDPTSQVLGYSASTTTTDGENAGEYGAYAPGNWYQSVKINYSARDVLSGINRIEFYHHYQNGSSLKRTLTQGELSSLKNELGFYSGEYQGVYLAAENGVYRVEIRVYDQSGRYTSVFSAHALYRQSGASACSGQAAARRFGLAAFRRLERLGQPDDKLQPVLRV
jgi:hypothetical protein